MHLEKLPEPIEMRCHSCGTTRLHVPVIINEDMRYQCTTCGEIKMSAGEIVKKELERFDKHEQRN